MILFYTIRLIEKVGIKLNAWAWNRLWRNRNDGIGYKHFKNKKKN